jgi:phosphate:Na+ symporter
MTTTLTLLDLAGSVALLLWGVHMVQSGVQRTFGPELRRWLGLAMGNRCKAAIAGAGVTAVLQSSTATGLMITSFAANDLVALVPALAVMLGANVGTTLIVQLLSFDVSRLFPLLLLSGVVMFRAGAAPTRDLGRVAIGLGLMLMALVKLLETITPYEDVPSIRLMMGAIATDPLIAAIFGALVTWMAHSSVAVVLIVMSFAAKGIVPLSAALALVVGANFGTALNPFFEGSSSGDVAGRRVSFGNLLNRLIGAAIVLPLISWISPNLARVEPELSRAVADFHTVFNLAFGFVALPFLGPFARLLQRLLPDRIEPADPSRPLYLDPTAIGTPSIALGHAAREALRMTDILDEMLNGSGDLLENYDRHLVSAIRRQEDVLDALNGAIKRYLTLLDPEGLTEEEHRRLTAILTFVLNLENSGDVVARNITSIASRLAKRGLTLSREGDDEVKATFEHIRISLRSAASVFMTEDARAARFLTEQKTTFRARETDAIQAHLGRLRDQRSETAQTSTLHLDFIRDIKRINDHLVAGSAYPVLEAGGHLMASRLRDDDNLG